MSRNLLKEAIADAKAVKETAIANAKVYLEEAFTPQLRSMLAAKLEEMDEDEINEKNEFKSDRSKGGRSKTTRGTEKMKDEMEPGGKLSETEEELDLDEILASLEEDTADVKEAEEEEVEDVDIDVDIDDEEVEGEEEEINIEDMSEDDLKDFISGVIDAMIADGELEAGEGYEVEDEIEGEFEEEEVEIAEKDDPLEKKVGDTERWDYEKGKRAGEKEISEKDDPLEYEVGKKERKTYEKGKKAGEKAEKEKIKEAYSTIKILKSELQEINLLNAKLLYTNKIFRSKNLTEAQKVKILNAFDKAGTVKEVKIVFETLNENIKVKTKTRLKESLGFASKATGRSKVRRSRPVVETDPMVERFKKLAGIT